MTVFVKICGMTDAGAVQAAIDAGADAIGFVFYARSPRNLGIEKAAGLAALVPDPIKKVAVMFHPESELWNSVRDNVEPDVLQTDLEDFRTLDVPAGIECWPVIREGATPDEFPETFVYEGKASGQGETVDWQIAAGYANKGRMMLAGGLSGDNVATAIAEVRPWGVDVSSAVESAPGVKDAGKIAAFVAAARGASQEQESD